MAQRSTEEFRARLRSLGLSADGFADKKEQRHPPLNDGENKTLEPGAAAAKIDAVIADPDGNIPVEAVAADMARQLEEYFQQFGDKRFRDAAHLLIKPLRNRPTEDHELDLAIMSVLTQGENALGDMEAAHKVASHYPEQDRERITKRLYDQWQRRGRC